MFPGQHLLRHAVRRHVRVAPQPFELRRNARAGLAAEQVRERPRASGGRRILLGEPLRPRARGGHGEQLRSGIHEAEQHRLTLLELRAEAHHRVEHAAGEPAGSALHVAHVRRERSELGVLGPEAPADPAGRIPPGVEPRRARQPGQALPQRLPGQHHVPGDLQVPVDRLAGDEQVHDLARALEDQVDTEVAHDALDGHRLLAPGSQGVGGLVAAAAADLQRVVDDPPPRLGVVQFRDRRFEPDVVAPPVGHRAAQLGYRFHRERVRRHRPDLLRDGVVLADRLAPLHALVGPGAADLQAPLGGGHRGDGQRQPAGVEGDEGELETLALAPQHVLLGDPHVREAHHAVVDRLEPHEMAAVLDVHPRPARLDDEGGDLPPLPAVYHLRRRPRHHHEQLRDGAVRAPQLLAVQDVGAAVGGRHGGRGHAGGVRADVVLGQGEGRDCALGQPRQVALLLLFGAEELERLRHADRLMRREQRHQRSALGAGHREVGERFAGMDSLAVMMSEDLGHFSQAVAAAALGLLRDLQMQRRSGFGEQTLIKRVSHQGMLEQIVVRSAVETDEVMVRIWLITSESRSTTELISVARSPSSSPRLI